MQLLINSGGYDQLSKLSEQQRQEIRDNRPKPREETSTRSPYKEVDPKKRKVVQESSPFKRPTDGISPPRRASRQKERVNEWVREQRELGRNIRMVPAIMPPIKESRERQRRKSEDIPKPVVSTREQGSQMENELPESLRKFVMETIEEQMKLSQNITEKPVEDKEGMGIVKYPRNLPEQLPIGSPPSYTTEVRRSQRSKERRDDTPLKERRGPSEVQPEIIYSQKYVSDEERMRGLSIPGPINLGHLSPPGIPREGEYRELDRQQTSLKEGFKGYPHDIKRNKKNKPPIKTGEKSTVKPKQVTSYPQPIRQTITREVSQEQPRFVIPLEISPAEYLEAVEDAKIIANRQGKPDIREILQTVLMVRVQGKREFEKSSTRQVRNRGSSQRGYEPPRQPPNRPPDRGGAGGDGGGGGGDDPSEPDDAGDEEEDSEEENETDSESGEGSIREQLPPELRGRRMYRLNLPLTQGRHGVRVQQPNDGGGGGGNSPSSSPSSSDHRQN